MLQIQEYLHRDFNDITFVSTNKNKRKKKIYKPLKEFSYD